MNMIILIRENLNKKFLSILKIKKKILKKRILIVLPSNILIYSKVLFSPSFRLIFVTFQLYIIIEIKKKNNINYV